MNYTPGFYWVWQYSKSQRPTVARLKKAGGWEYMQSEHSSKMMPGGPYKVIYKIEEPNTQHLNDE